MINHPSIIRTTLISIALLIATLVPAQEQELSDTATVERTIQVEKDYIPEIKDVKRPQIELKARNISSTKDNVEYSQYDEIITPRSTFTPLPQTDLRILKRRKADNGFAQLAFGFPINWNAEVFYPLVDKSKTSITLHGRHNGIYTTPSNSKQFIDTEIDFNIKHKVSRKTMIFAELAYTNLFYNYYGVSSINSPSTTYFNVNNQILRGDSIMPTSPQVIHGVNASFGLKNIKADADLRYTARADYKFTHFTNNHLDEHTVTAYGGISKSFLKMHALNIYADVNATIYNQPANIIPTQSTTNTVIGIYPSYTLSLDNLRVRAGAKIFVSTPNGTTITGSPDVHVSYLYKDLLDITAGIDGYYMVNSLSNIIKENAYYNPNLAITDNTYSPFKIYASVNVKPIKGLLINGYINFATVKNQYFFTNQQFQQLTDPTLGLNSPTQTLYSNMFTADISNANLFRTGFAAKYNHKEKYIAYLNFDYTKGVTSAAIQPWYLPTFKVKVGGDVELIDNLHLHLNFNFESGGIYKTPNLDGTACISKLSNIYDLNFSAYYTIMNRWTIFANVNNILGNISGLEYSRWYGYRDMGCNVLFGLNFSF